MIGRLKPTGEGARQQFPGWIIQLAASGAAKIRKQTVWSEWGCVISTQKIELEASNNNSATEIYQGGHRGILAVGRIEVTLGFVNHFTWKWLLVENCQQEVGDQWGHEFCEFRFRKSVYGRIRQITFFRVSRVPKQWTGIFKVSNTCTNLCKKKRGTRSRIPRKDSKRMSMPASWREFLGFGFFCQSSI